MKPDYYYNQSAVLPYQRARGGWQVVLITSRSGKRWNIPKGIVDPGLSALESAQKEGREEAGVEGIPSPTPIGEYQYEKWGGVCTVVVFPLLVTRVHDTWPEDDFRQRWVLPFAEGIDCVSLPQLQKIFRDFYDQLPGDSG